MTWMPRRVLSPGVRCSKRLSVNDDRAALLGRLHAGNDLDQRRLARAVLADQAMDLARLEAEVDVAERVNAAESLGNVAEFEERHRGSLATTRSQMSFVEDGYKLIAPTEIDRAVSTLPHGYAFTEVIRARRSSIVPQDPAHRRFAAVPPPRPGEG